MACDFSVAHDLARFGQAGPKHGSAPIGGATDFLPLMVGVERAMAACVLCEPFSAHQAYEMGILTDIAPALKVDGKFVANPMVETQRLFDEFGRKVYGSPKTGDAAKEGKALMAKGTVDLSALDEKVEALCAKMLLTFPECTLKTVEELRKPKLADVGPQQGKLARLAGPEHDDRGPRRLHGLQPRRQGRPRGRLRAPAPEAGRRPELAGQAARADPAEEGLKVHAMAESCLKVWVERDGALLRLRLARPKANIVDAAMILALHAALREHRGRHTLRGVLLDAEGPHFSFGASVEEHLPGNCAQMLASLHALLIELLEFPVPVLVAVRGQCLGGGLELAMAGGPDLRHRGRAARPARDQAGRVRAGGVGAAAVPRQPGDGRGPAVLGPVDQRQ